METYNLVVHDEQLHVLADALAEQYVRLKMGANVLPIDCPFAETPPCNHAYALLIRVMNLITHHEEGYDARFLAELTEMEDGKPN